MSVCNGFICYILHSDWFFGIVATANLATKYSQGVNKHAMALCSPSCLGIPEWTECCKQNSRFASIITDEEAEKHREDKQMGN